MKTIDLFFTIPVNKEFKVDHSRLYKYHIIIGGKIFKITSFAHNVNKNGNNDVEVMLDHIKPLIPEAKMVISEDDSLNIFCEEFFSLFE